MHTRAGMRPIVRPLFSMAVVLLMLASPLAAVLPVGAVQQENIDDLTLPMEWTLEGGDSASFDVTLPVGDVTEASLALEGAGVEVSESFTDDVDAWTGGDNVVMEGFDTSSGSLEAATEHRLVWEGPGDLGSDGPVSGVVVDPVVSLALTSPKFTGDRGGIWRYYIPLEISLNTGQWEHDTLTFINLDIPPGHCKDINEIRVADPTLREVPVQVIDVETSVTDGSVVYVELLFRTDMPPDGSRIYRVYYGNPGALDPGYTPLLLGAELWNYGSVLDANFVAAWSHLRWAGGLGDGTGTTRFGSLGGNVKQLEQTVTINPGRTFSQVWTSKALKNGDFQMTTWVGSFAHKGPRWSTAMWALDFRVSGDDCYRLMYTEVMNDGSMPKLSLLRVSTDRHYTTGNTTSSWTLMDELAVEPIGNSTVPVRVRCSGPNIDIWVGGSDTPALRARDNTINMGEFGTFVGGRGVLFTGTDTVVGCAIGPVLIMPVDVNISDRSHAFFPHEERQQHFLSGTWVSDAYHLEGARDSILSMDVGVPFDTKYVAALLNAAGDTTVIDDIKDGMQVPEEALAHGFRLRVELVTNDDSVSPELRGWGLGYRAMLNPLSDRGPSLREDMGLMDGALSLTPSRDVWIKEDLPVLSPGNIDEDANGVTIGSVVPYGDSFRVYYTGTSSTGVKTICVAISNDGETFNEFRPVLSGPSMSMGWDAVRSDPDVLFLGDVWLMYYIGERATSQVGLALSGNGLDWSPLDNPVFSPGGFGFDGGAILDCHVVLYNNLFMMYYTGMGTNMNSTAIGYAFSADGGTWTRSPSNPVLKPASSSSAWDSGYIRSPHLVPTRDQYVLYYLGGKGSDVEGGMSSIGYATSTNGLDFTKAAANPVLEPRVGGITDDYRGVRGLVVFEDMDGRYGLIYSAQGMDWRTRVFEARSGYDGDGYYVSKPYQLDRRPDSFIGFKVDGEVPAATNMTVSIRTSQDGNTWTEWLDTGGSGQGDEIPTEEWFQLRIDMTSKFGDATPRLFNVIVDYASAVSFSTMTVFPVQVSEEEFISIQQTLSGTGTDDVSTDVYLEGMGWSDLALYTGHARYGTGPDFGYRFNLTSPPARVHSLDNVTFTLSHVSLPTEVWIDVGDDGTRDWTFELPEFEGLHELSVAGPTKTWMDEKADGAEDLTISITIHSQTPGTLILHSVSFVVDTAPRVVSTSPGDMDVYMQEGDSQAFSLTVDELDGDDVSYTWYVDTETVGTSATYTYTAPVDEDTDDPAPVVVKVEVTDGTHSAPPVQWTVHVEDTTELPNQGPFVDTASPDDVEVTMKENTSQEFTVYVVDPDLGPDALTYTWYVNGTQVASGSDQLSYEFMADYDAAGTYTVRLEATDGLATASRDWSLTVTNVKKPGTGGPDDPNGDGNPDEPSIGWFPLLLIIIVGALVVGGTLYMRGQRAKLDGEIVPEGGEPVTADVPLEPEPVPEPTPEPAPEPTPEPAIEHPAVHEPAHEPTHVVQSSSTETGSLGKSVSAGPGPESAATAAAPLGILPLADLDKDRTFVVEEVYVIYNDGRLMCHQARAERTSVDTDLFGGMFTAIQQFIHDSMGEGMGASTQVGRLDYGENRILVERGNYVFLATIIFGEEQESLREAMRDALNRIEGSYAGVIERWSGDQTQLSGVGAFVAPLLGLTQDLNREAIMSRTRTVGVKMLSEVEFFQGFVRLKVAVKNDTKMVITNVATDIVYDSTVLRVDRIQPEYPMSGTKVTLGTIGPREKKTVAYYLDPLICQESDIDGTTSYKDAEGAFATVTMKRRRADIVCPIFFTEENANTAMLKRLIHEELKESDSKLFTIPKMLDAPESFKLGKEVIRSHDVRFVREFIEQEEGTPYRAEAWYYGVTKVKKDKMVIRTSIWEDRKTIEFFVAAGRIESITGLLAELGQNLNKALKEKYLGRVSADPVMDLDEQNEVKGLGLLIDKYSEGEMDAGEVDQQ